MEVRAEEAEPLARDAGEHAAARRVQVLHQRPHAGEAAVMAAMREHQAQVVIEHDGPKDRGGHQHGAGAQQVAAQARLDHAQPHVVGHRLVLGLLHRVPHPHLRVAVDRAVDALLVAFQQQVGEHRRVVLQRDRDGQLHRGRQVLLEQPQDQPEPLVELVRGQAGGLQQVVVLDVLARVHRLLADEADHLLLELGIVDLVAIMAHRVHEETLAGREQQRQRVHEVGDGHPLHVPVARAVGGHGETDVTADGHHDGSP